MVRGISDGDELYEVVSNRLGSTHPLLTRAVLVRRLIDVASNIEARDALLAKLGNAPHDYFFEFVNAIIDREASEKWIDRSGEPARALISTDEHHELLSFIAQEMWLANSNEINTDSLDLVVELNSETQRKDTAVTRQIKERIKQHALLVSTTESAKLFAFDHEEFRDFFLGQAIGRRIVESADSDLRSILRESPLPRQAYGAAIQYLKRSGFDLVKAIGLLQAFGESDLVSSFIRENCGGLIIRLLNDSQLGNLTVKNLTFPVDALHNRQLREVTFANCYFQETELENLEMENCTFDTCRFDLLDFYQSTTIKNCTMQNCEVVSVFPRGTESRIYAPDQIRFHLTQIGFILDTSSGTEAPPISATPLDENMRSVDRMLRCFLRTTAVHDDVLRLRLGVRASVFIKEVIPQLIKAGIIVIAKDSHYKLGVPMRRIDEAISLADGSFDLFLREFTTHHE